MKRFLLVSIIALSILLSSCSNFAGQNNVGSDTTQAEITAPDISFEFEGVISAISESSFTVKSSGGDVAGCTVKGDVKDVLSRIDNGNLVKVYGSKTSGDDKSLKIDVYKIEKLASPEDYLDNYVIDYEYDTETATSYTVIRVFKQKTDGSYQYPFVYAPDGAETGTKSTLDMMNSESFVLAINAGIFYPETKVPDGIIIENSKVISNLESVTHPNCKPLTIDTNGYLSYAESTADANELAENGIVSAVCGFMPIIVDYNEVPDSEWNYVEHYTNAAQRQIIGQFENGDYAVITCEGRDFQNSRGWTIAEAQQICKSLGLKFAYNLDGGGSTETVLIDKQLNTIYEETTGRIVPTYIVFNGRDTFEK